MSSDDRIQEILQELTPESGYRVTSEVEILRKFVRFGITGYINGLVSTGLTKEEAVARVHLMSSDSEWVEGLIRAAREIFTS